MQTFHKEDIANHANEFTAHDSLAATSTRLTANAKLVQALVLADASNEPCSIVLLNQNARTGINDHWNQVVGDDVLAKTATFIQNNLRINDTLFKLDGGECLILLPKASKNSAEKIMARIQETYNAFECQSNDTHAYKSTFSFGIAESSEGLTVKEWLMNADNNLYKNKS